MRVEWKKDNKIIARAMLFIIDKGELGKMGIIEEVWVHEDCRHERLGSNMVDFLIFRAKEEGCNKIILTCRDGIMPFYKRLGFNKYQNCMVKKFN